MEGAPSHIDSEALIKEIQSINEDIEIHDFHIWQLTSEKVSVSAHIRTSDPHGTLEKATEICKKFKLDHVTLQMEDISNNYLCG